jgi:hypothetical protein
MERDVNSEEVLRCYTPDEMRTIGMVQNKYGVWQYGLSKKQLEQTEAA